MKIFNDFFGDREMKKYLMSDKLVPVHSDIRGPIFVETLEMQKKGISVLKLNTGNPAAFGFKMPESVRRALSEIWTRQ